MDIKPYLLKLGLSEIEVCLYLELLNAGPSSVSRLAKVCGFARTTTYENIDKLITRGLIVRKINGRRKRFVAEAPDVLEKLLTERKINLENEAIDLQHLTQSLPVFITSLAASITDIKKNNAIDITYYEGKKEAIRAYEKILKASMIKSYTDSVAVMEYFPELFDITVQAYTDNTRLALWEIITRSHPEDAVFTDKVDSRRYFFKKAPDNLKLVYGFDYCITSQ